MLHAGSGSMHRMSVDQQLQRAVQTQLSSMGVIGQQLLVVLALP